MIRIVRASPAVLSATRAESKLLSIPASMNKPTASASRFFCTQSLTDEYSSMGVWLLSMDSSWTHGRFGNSCAPGAPAAADWGATG